MRIALLASSFIVALVPVASALPLSYSEFLSGDVDDPRIRHAPFRLDVGVNTVTGEMSRLERWVDFDTFRFYIPKTLQLTQIRYEFDLHVLGESSGPGLALTSYSLDDAPFDHPVLDHVEVDLTGPSALWLFSAALPLGRGRYDVFQGFMNNPPFVWTAKYTWELTVEALPPTPIPEPATLVLIVAGGLGLARRLRVG